MIRTGTLVLLLPTLLLAAGTAQAAERRQMVTSFDRVRVEGPFQVAVVVGRSPGAVLSSADTRQFDRIVVRVDGTTLIVRAAPEGGSAAQAGGSPVTVALTTLTLTSASMLGGGAMTIGGARAARLDLSVAGAGSIALTGADTAQANATVIGNGSIALAGRATQARLTVSGAGRIAAESFEVGDLTVVVDGPGEAAARARFTANVTNAGLGRVTVVGSPRCTVRNPAGGPVSCGAGAN